MNCTLADSFANTSVLEPKLVALTQGQPDVTPPLVLPSVAGAVALTETGGTRAVRLRPGYAATDDTTPSEEIRVELCLSVPGGTCATNPAVTHTLLLGTLPATLDLAAYLVGGKVDYAARFKDGADNVTAWDLHESVDVAAPTASCGLDNAVVASQNSSEGVNIRKASGCSFADNTTSSSAIQRIICYGVLGDCSGPNPPVDVTSTGTVTVPVTEFPTGIAEYRYVLADSPGNQTSWSSVKTIALDTEPPVVTPGIDGSVVVSAINDGFATSSSYVRVSLPEGYAVADNTTNFQDLRVEMCFAASQAEYVQCFQPGSPVPTQELWVGGFFLEGQPFPQLIDPNVNGSIYGRYRWKDMFGIASAAGAFETDREAPVASPSLAGCVAVAGQPGQITVSLETACTVTDDFTEDADVRLGVCVEPDWEYPYSHGYRCGGQTFNGHTDGQWAVSALPGTVSDLPTGTSPGDPLNGYDVLVWLADANGNETSYAVKHVYME